nr:hypothetical protein [Burkholderiales bacterium]
MIKFPLRGFGILFLYASVSLLVINAYALSATGQADVRVTADVDTTTVSTEEMITLTVTIEGVIEQLDDPRLPELDGMRVSTSTRSSQFNLVDGTVTSRTIFSYRLQPVKRGVLTIPSIPVSVNGATYGTEPIVISVVDVTSGDPGTPSVEGSNPDSPAQSDTNAPEETCASAPYPFVADDLRDQDFFV